MKELIIIGAGPAGLSAAIYGVRAGMDICVIERFAPGGQVVNTYEVENYPGFADPVAGWELMGAMEKQAKRLGVEIQNGEIKQILKKDKAFVLSLSDGKDLTARAVIITSGASYKKLSVPGETELTGRGVSYCATCDGAFFKDKITAVVGGGNTALEEALFLTKFASKVYMIHRRDTFRGNKILQDRLLANDKVHPLYDSVVQEITGNEKVSGIKLKNLKTGNSSLLELDGVFIFTGSSPNTDFIDKTLLNERGEISVDIEMRTHTEGLFAAGDCRSFSKKQIVTAAADGATAAINAYEYILRSGLK